MNDYKKYLLSSMGLTEAQFIPSSLLEKDEFPGIDPDELEKGEEEEAGEHGMSREKARQTATDHLGAPKQGHYYTGVEKAKQAGMLKDQAMLSPTARPTPVIGLAIRGSTTGGLPSGADQIGRDISPSKVGGYDRVTPQNLNSKLVDKTPNNPEIRQTSTPINPDPQTGDGITHPHQIQVTAHEEPQAATGASTDSDDTLKLKSAVPKGIDIDIAETSPEEEKNEDNNTAMIPSTSLSETFERHKQMMREKIDLTRECTTCGCGDPNDTHGMEPQDEVMHTDKGIQDIIAAGMQKANGNKEQAILLLTQASQKLAAQGSNYSSNLYAQAAAAMKGDAPVSENEDGDDDEDGICSACNGSGEGPADGTRCYTCKGSGSTKGWSRRGRPEPDPDYEMERRRDKQMGLEEDKKDKGETVECKECHNPFNYRLVAEVSMGAVKCPVCDAVLDQNGTVLAEGKHKAGCQCGFCKNKGSFGKKKKEVAEGDEADSMSDQDQELQADRDFGKDKDSKKDKKAKKDKAEKQQRIDESYAAPFQRMRSLAGVGNMILTSNGLMEDRNDPGASKPFNTNWKMDKEKAGFVKIDEEKLNKIKASLERKSKRGTLSDDELELAKKLTEVLKRRQLKENDDVAKGEHQNDPWAADKLYAKMQKDKNLKPFPFDKDHTGPMRHGNEKGQLPAS